MDSPYEVSLFVPQLQDRRSASDTTTDRFYVPSTEVATKQKESSGYYVAGLSAPPITVGVVLGSSLLDLSVSSWLAGHAIGCFSGSLEVTSYRLHVRSYLYDGSTGIVEFVIVVMLF